MSNFEKNSLEKDKFEKHKEALKYHFGEFYDVYCADKVIEFSVNNDGTVWLEKLGEPMKQIGTMSSSNVMSIINLVADSFGTIANAQTPIVEGEFPLDDSRFEGIAPPISERGMFSIRKRASQLITIEEYVDQGILEKEHLEFINSAIKQKFNIVVAGGTGSGKTTFVNALIHQIGVLCPEDRIGIIESTRELQCASLNKFFLRSTSYVSETALVKAMLRLRPDRIIFGEVRGNETQDLLMAWNTGHPGGICTIHSDSAIKTFTRFEELTGNKCNIIGDTLHVVVYLKKIRGHRKVTQILRCYSYNKQTQEYNTESIYNLKENSHAQ